VSIATPFFREELDRFADRYRLTAREHDVLYLLVTGCSTVPQIAGQLTLSQNTVHNHFKKRLSAHTHEHEVRAARAVHQGGARAPKPASSRSCDDRTP